MLLNLSWKPNNYNQSVLSSIRSNIYFLSVMVILSCLSDQISAYDLNEYNFKNNNQATRVDDEKIWAEKRLIKGLLEDYDKTSRPVVDDVTKTIKNDGTITQQLTIEFGIELYQILDLNEMDQVLTTSVRSLYRWQDHFLTWVPAEVANITSIEIPSNEIWLPDISLYNYADERMSERKDCNVIVHYDGTVEWYPLAIYKSNCFVSITYFPFDSQKCRMKFGPWTYDGWRVNISFYDKKEILWLDNFVESSEWKVLQTKSEFNTIKYICCPEIYVDISYYLYLKRQPAFYRYILILPCFLLSTLTLVLFWLPPETPAKIVLGMNIFVAFFLLLLLLKDITPSAASNFPLLGVYYCFNMGIITLSAFLSCITVNLHFRTDEKTKLPTIVKIIMFKYVAKFLWVKSIGNYDHLTWDGIKSRSSDESSDEDKNPINQVLYGTQGSDSFSPNASTPCQVIVPLKRSKKRKPKTPNGDSSETHTIITNSFVSDQLNCDLCNYGKYPVNQTSIRPQDYRKTEPSCCNICNQSSYHEISRYSQPEYNYARQPVKNYSQTNVNTRKSKTCWCQNLLKIKDTSNYLNSSQLKRAMTMKPYIINTPITREYDPLMMRTMGLPCNCHLCLENEIKKEEINTIISDVTVICDTLKFIRTTSDQKKRTQQIIDEWRDLGTILDRIFFIFYFIAVIASILIFFIASGNNESVLEDNEEAPYRMVVFTDEKTNESYVKEITNTYSP